MRVLLVTTQDDYEFPLAEAARKQVWHRARQYRRDGFDVKLIIFSARDGQTQVRDDISLSIMTRRTAMRELRRQKPFDLIHYYGAPGLGALVAAWAAPGAHRIMSLTDGGVYARGRRRWVRKAVAPIVRRAYDEMQVFTRYQSTRLGGGEASSQRKITFTRPLLPEPRDVASLERSPNPSLLYMGHFSPIKGADLVLEVFEKLRSDIPRLSLTIAWNGLYDNDDSRGQIEGFKERYGGSLRLLGKVDPFAELRRAHLYLYPVRCHRGTFAFPLSLYESLQCQTPFLSSRLSGFREFFSESFLVTPDDVEAYASRAREILDNPYEWRARAAAELQRLHSRWSE